MGLPPTQGNESQTLATPAQAGTHVGHLGPRFRGNDVTFEGAQRSISAVPSGGQAANYARELPRSFAVSVN